jgi:hypothetical protein
MFYTQQYCKVITFPEYILKARGLNLELAGYLGHTRAEAQ